MTDIKTETSPVRMEQDGSTAVVVIDNPPVNASSWAVRQGLVSALQQLSTDASISEIVLIGAGKSFISGADIKEFSGPLRDPQMPAVIAAVEACPKPVVAAIHGAAFGAGYELALGCDARIAACGALVGLPEVMLGIIPGAGGTQRLPRLVGLSQAIELITTGQRVKAENAFAIGMIDALAAGDLREEAIRLARSMTGRKRRLTNEPIPAEPDAAIAAAADKALARAKGSNAIREAVAVIRRNAAVPFAEALADERTVFQRLRGETEAAAKRYLFFAEREAFRIPGVDAAAARPIRSVGIIGAGTMGAGIAATFLDADLPVTLIERDTAALKAGVERIAAIYQRMVDSKRIGRDAMDARLSRINATTDMTALASADLVVEAVFEDMAVKQALLRELDGILKPGVVLASNTSYLNLDELARATSRPGDAVGLHFFAPANIMRLIEIVRGADTAPDVLATALAVAKTIRKLPVVARVGEGFIGNRIYSAYRTQCEFMLEDGAMPDQIDKALTGFGFAMGPFAVTDMSGLDIAWRTRQRLAATRDPKARYSDILDKLCEAGRLGRKAGKGWYAYEADPRRGVVDDTVRNAIEDASRRKGITRRTFTNEQIVRRALVAMANEAALLLAEGIAARASDIDLVMVNGYGFPPEQGGPLFWASRQPSGDLNAIRDELAASTGYGFRRGDIASAIQQIGQT